MASSEMRMYNKITAEFIGTFMLVFTVCCNVLSGTSGAFAALSIASVLMVMIYSLGGVSGAHFNPAVSVTIALVKQAKWSTTAAYVLTQLVAGVTAGFAAHLMFGKAFNLEPGAGYTWVECAMAEVLYTFLLCFVVLNVAVAKSTAGNQFYGLAIGYVIVAGGYSVGKISGCALNPAVALGIDASSAHIGFGWSVAYSGFQMGGAALAALVYKLVHPEEFPEDPKSALSTSNVKPEVPLYSKLTAEFVGTYFLVLTVGLNVLTGSLAAAFSIAASLMVLIYALGCVSGAHFNPAVTLAIFFSGRDIISQEDVVKYILAQVSGAMCAAYTYSTMTGGKTFPLGPVGATTWTSALFVEAIFTFVLCITVLTVATSKHASRDLFGLAIGSCVTVGGFAAGALSGGSLNPAVSVGIDFVHSMKAVDGSKGMNSGLYSLAEIGGAAAAAWVFGQTYVGEYSKKK